MTQVSIKAETALVIREILKESIQQLTDGTHEISQEDFDATKAGLTGLLDDVTRGLIKADVI